MTGPLHGIRIIDLTAMISGPLATMMLADQGAEVIKVENPAGGDFTRSALNLKEPAGREALLRMVSTADVFVQNFRPGVIERMGLGEEELRKVAPNLIMVSISGFGDTGPYSQRPVYDPLIQGLSGLNGLRIQGSEHQNCGSRISMRDWT